MDLLKFRVLTGDGQMTGLDEQVMLINSDHLVSIKPIRIMIDEDVIDGFWIRTSNGKKYRATEIPQEIYEQLKEDLERDPLATPHFDHHPHTTPLN